MKLEFNLNQSRRQFVADKLGDLANIIAGAMVIGQFISNQPFDLKAFTLGLVVSLVAYLISYRIII